MKKKNEIYISIGIILLFIVAILFLVNQGIKTNPIIQEDIINNSQQQIEYDPNTWCEENPGKCKG